jgi:hypothetical protein
MRITILSSSGFHARLSEVLPHFTEAEVKIFPGRALYSPEARDAAVKSLKQSDINLVYASEEPLW